MNDLEGYTQSLGMVLLNTVARVLSISELY